MIYCWKFFIDTLSLTSADFYGLDVGEKISNQHCCISWRILMRVLANENGCKWDCYFHPWTFFLFLRMIIALPQIKILFFGVRRNRGKEICSYISIVMRQKKSDWVRSKNEIRLFLTGLLHLYRNGLCMYWPILTVIVPLHFLRRDTNWEKSLVVIFH